MNLKESQAGNHLRSYKMFRVKEEKEAQLAKEEKELIRGGKENKRRKIEAKREAKRKKLL